MLKECKSQPLDGIVLYQKGDQGPKEAAPGLMVLAGASRGHGTVVAGWQFTDDEKKLTVESVVLVGSLEDSDSKCVVFCSEEDGSMRTLALHQVGEGTTNPEHQTSAGFAPYLVSRTWDAQLEAHLEKESPDQPPHKPTVGGAKVGDKRHAGQLCECTSQYLNVRRERERDCILFRFGSGGNRRREKATCRC